MILVLSLFNVIVFYLFAFFEIFFRTCSWKPVVSGDGDEEGLYDFGTFWFSICFLQCYRALLGSW